MKIAVVVVGKAKAPLREAIEVYERRVGRYWRVEVVEVRGEASGDPGHVRDVEAARIAARLPEGYEVVALTREGRAWGSDELARYLEAHAVRASAGVAFALGGAYGLGQEVLARAHHRLSLSPMTLPHEMARLVLAEQLYRAGTILRGEPYHKARPPR